MKDVLFQVVGSLEKLWTTREKLRGWREISKAPGKSFGEPKSVNNKAWFKSYDDLLYCNRFDSYWRWSNGGVVFYCTFRGVRASILKLASHCAVCAAWTVRTWSVRPCCRIVQCTADFIHLGGTVRRCLYCFAPPVHCN